MQGAQTTIYAAISSKMEGTGGVYREIESASALCFFTFLLFLPFWGDICVRACAFCACACACTCASVYIKLCQTTAGLDELQAAMCDRQSLKCAVAIDAQHREACPLLTDFLADVCSAVTDCCASQHHMPVSNTLTLLLSHAGESFCSASRSPPAFHNIFACLARYCEKL